MHRLFKNTGKGVYFDENTNQIKTHHPTVIGSYELTTADTPLKDEHIDEALNTCGGRKNALKMLNDMRDVPINTLRLLYSAKPSEVNDEYKLHHKNMQQLSLIHPTGLLASLVKSNAVQKMSLNEFKEVGE